MTAQPAAADPPGDVTVQRLNDLTRMCVELGAELWVVRDRLAILEHLLEQRAGISRHEIDEFTPDGVLAAELAAERAGWAQRLLGPGTARQGAPPPSGSRP